MHSHPEAKALRDQSPYLDRNGQPSMLESIVVSADILGYREATCSAHHRNEEAELFERLRIAVCSTSEYLEDAYEYSEKEIYFGSSSPSLTISQSASL